MNNMFAELNQAGSVNLPLFETRKALIIINLQNDSLYVKDDLYITKNRDFVPRLKEMIPYFRKHGEVVWVQTHMGILAPPPAPDAAKVEEEAAKLAEKNRQEQKRKEQQIKDDSQSEQAREEAARRDQLDPIDPNASPGKDYPMFYPTSKTKEIMQQASAETRAEKRSADLQVFDDKDNQLEKHLSKPRKGQQARFYIAGTKGAELCEELQGVVDESLDLIVTKHHYSAFDQTSLLTALRAKLVTEVYLCGCLTNVGVYSTAADAVQHGLQVTVVEDCLGYRSEEKHEEAIRQMANIMGVHGIDSEEIIEESGGRPVPDAETPGITLDELSIDSPKVATRGLPDGVRAAVRNQEAAMIDVEETSPGVQSLPQGNVPVSPKYKLRKSVDEERKSSQEASSKNRGSWNLQSQTVGPDDDIGSGDSKIIHNAIKPPTMNAAFTKVKEEVKWQTMFHRSGQVPRLVAVQGETGPEGEIPLYRHPADESPRLLPFTPMIQRIRQEVEMVLGQPFNHALIQLYRDGSDNISEHSDKTLDLVRGSAIVNVSLGAQRMMTLRTKKSKHANGTDSPSMRQSQRVKLPHNSIFVLGPRTNREWLHGVRADKRPGHEKTEEEKAYGGERISITFRQIGTYMDKSERVIWGGGAKGRNRHQASTISKDGSQMEAMINAFGKENHNANFDWDAEYGPGFDVVNLVSKQAKLLLCTDDIANHRAQLSLCEKSIPFTVKVSEAKAPVHNDIQTRFHTWMHGLSNTDNPIFYDIDHSGSGVEGDLAIMLHLEKHYPIPASIEDSTLESEGPSASMYTHLSQSNELLFHWRQYVDSMKDGRESPVTNRFKLEKPKSACESLSEDFHDRLAQWEIQSKSSNYIAGDKWTIIDCAFWPVLNHLISAFDELDEGRYPSLLAYHRRVLGRECVQTILGGKD